jgi:glycosyltransferase involved in cell wall biosynthesis
VSDTRIVGIMLVRDEDLFVEQAVRNVLDFCDEIVLADNGSHDETIPILERLVSEHPDRLSLHRIRDPSLSHDLIKGYAGEPVWVFGVDGDELYDPVGLRKLRRMLLDGELDDRWLVRGNALHCIELDDSRTQARGYLAPPSGSPTKLHNFGLIEAWDGPCPERLHGVDGLRFKPGRAGEKYGLNLEYGWEESPFRCLHVCFLRRSSRERRAQARTNIPDRNVPRRLPVRLAYRSRERLRGAIGLPERSPLKLRNYRLGERTTVDASPFFDSRPSAGRSA